MWQNRLGQGGGISRGRLKKLTPDALGSGVHLRFDVTHEGFETVPVHVRKHLADPAIGITAQSAGETGFWGIEDDTDIGEFARCDKINNSKENASFIFIRLRINRKQRRLQTFTFNQQLIAPLFKQLNFICF